MSPPVLISFCLMSCTDTRKCTTYLTEIVNQLLLIQSSSAQVRAWVLSAIIPENDQCAQHMQHGNISSTSNTVWQTTCGQVLLTHHQESASCWIPDILLAAYLTHISCQSQTAVADCCRTLLFDLDPILHVSTYHRTPAAHK